MKVGAQYQRNNDNKLWRDSPKSLEYLHLHIDMYINAIVLTMERRMRRKPLVRCGAGEKSEITSKIYLLRYYISRAYDTINFRTPKGGRELVKTFALENGYTMNDFLRKMVCEGMRREGFEFDPALIFPEAVMPEELAKEDK